MKRTGGIGKKKRNGLRMRDVDALFSKVVRARGRCQAAGLDNVRCGGPLQTAHIEGRRKMVLRYDEMNALCLCAGHHRHYSDYPLAWSKFIEENFPQHYQHIWAHRNEMWDRDFQRVADELQARI